MTTEKHPLAGGSRTGPRACASFRFLLSWLTRVNLFLFFCGLASAQTSGTFSGSMGITGTWEITGDTLSAVGEFTSDYNGDQISLDLGSGGGVSGPQATGPGQVKAFSLSISIGSATDGVGRLRIFSTNNGSVSTYVRATASWNWNTVIGYVADFRVPANTGTEPVKVRFYQDGDLLTTLTVNPGDSAQTLHLTGLEVGKIVTAVYSYGNKVMSAGGTITFEADKEFEHAGGGMPVSEFEPQEEPYPLLPMRDTYGITPEVEPLDPPDPETPQDAPDPTDPVTPQTPVTKPTRGAVGIPFGSPSGTGGATKEDLETSTNALANALDEIDTNRQASDDALLDALNAANAAQGENGEAVRVALDALREETVTGRNKQLAATAKTNTAITGLRDDVRKGNVALGQIASTLGELELQGRAPEADKVQSDQSAIMALANSAQDTARAASEIMPETGDVRADTDISGDEWLIMIPFTEIAVNVNPLAQPNVLFLAELSRVLIGWGVVLALVAWTYIKIPKWHTEALQGGSGISVWKSITGAVPGIGVAVMLGLWVLAGALVLTSPTLLWAASDPHLMGQAAFAFVDVRDMIELAGDNAGASSSTVSRIIGLINAVCPVGLMMQAFFNWVFLQITGQSIVAGVIALQKVLASG